MKQNYEELLEQVRGLGAYRAELIDVEKIRFDRAFRELCEQNACGNYGQCWMCPPDAGDIDELIAEAGSYRRALVYQTVGKLEDSYDFEGMMEAARVHGELSRRRQSCLKPSHFPGSCTWAQAAAMYARCAPRGPRSPAATRSSPCPRWKPTAWRYRSWLPPAE